MSFNEKFVIGSRSRRCSAAQTGSIFYRRLVVEARKYLKPGGHLVLEVGRLERRNIAPRSVRIPASLFLQICHPAGVARIFSHTSEVVGALISTYEGGANPFRFLLVPQLTSVVGISEVVMCNATLESCATVCPTKTIAHRTILCVRC